MQSQNKFFEDLSKLMNNAAYVANEAKSEAETAFNSWMDRFLAQRNLVTRDEFDAVMAMSQKAREENEALRSRIEVLEAEVAKKPKRRATRAKQAPKA
ncbi:MAG: accessory factor UbiK family protein [Albidovulum sp.]|nr:accessory factor UbiK family protein [Albidovulum sp.]MDE0534416.1 accessory factor UbiK family protein [Albidovulum sp.]